MTQDLVPGDAEKRLLAFGLALQEQDFGDAADRGLIGCIAARRVEGGCQFRAVIWPGLPGWQREKFAEWAGSRFARFSAHGPAPDGWQKQSTGGAWLLWGRLTLGQPQAPLGARSRPPEGRSSCIGAPEGSLDIAAAP